jgi:molybdate transport system substrate-binding protein
LKKDQGLVKQIQKAFGELLMRGFFAAAVILSISAATAAKDQPASPAPQQSCGTVGVAAASDLTYAMTEIAADFEKKSGCKLRVSLGSSGNFLTQIENGAPFDIFFSADVSYPKKLESDGLADAGGTYTYADGKLVLWTRNDSKQDVSKGLAILRDPSIRKVSIANPEHAPYGRAAEEALKKAGVYDAVKDRLVLGENVAQAAQFAQTGNADGGIFALSLALSPELTKAGHYSLVPENLYAPIEQGVVVIRKSQNLQGARALLDYVKTPAVVALLERYGFTLPGKSKP